MWAYKLLANEIAYEVTGGATFKTNVQTVVNDLVWHQNGAGGQLPANRVDGGLYHTGEQHDIDEASSASVLIASPWMSALVVDPMVRVFGVWQNNSQVSDFIIRMGNFEKVASKTDSDGDFGGVTRYPDYLMRADGTTDARSGSDVQHAIDVGAVAAWATYFAELRGTPDASLRQLANNLYTTYDIGVNDWTRPGNTNFNVSPPRRYSWEYKNSPSFSWALTGTDAQVVGDYNRNASVDSADYVLYRKTQGQTGVVPFSGADGDGDGAIEADDYGVWRSHFGNLSAAGAGATNPKVESESADISAGQGLADDPSTGPFTNVTASSGVGGIVAQQYQQSPNWWLSGEHLVDLDGDGDLDLFLDSHGGGNAVVALNDGHGVFTRVTTGTFPNTEIHQMVDINGDGKVDLAATYQDGGGQWWINNSTPGNISFTATNVTRGGNTSRSQVLIDFNGDGKVDWLRSAPPGLVIDYRQRRGRLHRKQSHILYSRHRLER